MKKVILQANLMFPETPLNSLEACPFNFASSCTTTNAGLFQFSSVKTKRSPLTSEILLSPLE